MTAKKQKDTVIVDSARIQEVLTRGVAETISFENLKKKLLSGKRLRVKLGIDPTSPNIHLGRAVTLLKLRDFQELGHIPVLIIGDATGVIGDTSDKDSGRPMLSSKEVKNNEKTYLKQIEKIVDLSRAEVHHNSKWLNKLSFAEIGEQADQFSISDFIARDIIKRRLVAGKRVSLRETLYPLMQGYDSVAIKADIEIGGTDQRFNVLSGRVLQQHYKQESQDVVIMEMLLGIDGRKMSSSWGNIIALTDTPNVMYANIMRVHDSLVMKYFEICTRVSGEEVARLQKEFATRPRELKMRLAREIVTLYHSPGAAQKAEEEFVKVFSNKELPSSMPETLIGNASSLEDVLMKEGMVPSKSEIRRLIEGGGLRDAETGEKIHEVKAPISKSIILKIGKKKFLKITLKHVPKKKE
ncbi:MAG: tyrosine--tRNA ligase [Candidatus Campbellbacteria bacterium]|nr:tyrosine--tRNA ligase [Candidatus Campbellbacteria bacterium]